MNERLIVVDIDGTISVVGDRLNCLKEKDWDSFYARCGEDTAKVEIIRIVEALQANLGARIVLVTGRRESCRSDTEEWVSENTNFEDYTLIMRPEGDYGHDTVVKFREFEKSGFNYNDVFCVFEDRNSMVEAWREKGITTLQVAKGDF